MSEGELTFWILVPLFLAVVMHLFIYGRRRSAMIQRFARANGLSHESRPSDEFEDKLTETFRIEEPGLIRAFSAVRDLIGDGRVRLFKCIEMLDLGRWGNNATSHHRIAVLFPVDPAHEHWSFYERGGRRMEDHPATRFADPAVARAMEATLREHPPRHPLSVTFARGKGLAYLQPSPTGSEKEGELGYLLKLGRALTSRFGDTGSGGIAANVVRASS